MSWRIASVRLARPVGFFRHGHFVPVGAYPLGGPCVGPTLRWQEIAADWPEKTSAARWSGRMSFGASLRAGSSRESDAGRCGGRLPQAATRTSYAARSQPSPWRRSGRHAHEKIDPAPGRRRRARPRAAQPYRTNGGCPSAAGGLATYPVVRRADPRAGERAPGRRRARERPCRPFRAPVLSPLRPRNGRQNRL